MSLNRILFGMLTGMMLAASTLVGATTDDELKAVLIGSWVSPPDNPTEDYVLPARQVFHDDGTTTLYIYDTPECRVPTAAFEAKWSVVNGVLITQVTGSSHPALVPLGQVEKVAIVAAGPERIVLDSEGTLYVREKSDICYAPDAHRT